MVKRRKSQNTVRPSLLNVRLSEAERKQFKQRATAIGLTLSAWARMVLRREVQEAQGHMWRDDPR